MAVITQVSVLLNKGLVAWPTDLAPVDFLQSDDADFLLGVWEGYSTEADRFRSGRKSPGSSTGVAAPASASPVVPESLPAST
jgi:hypothetical protein